MHYKLRVVQKVSMGLALVQRRRCRGAGANALIFSVGALTSQRAPVDSLRDFAQHHNINDDRKLE